MALATGRDRVVLALLLLRAGRPATVEEFVDAVWPDGPPATARGQVQSCVSRLRRLLTTIEAADDLRTTPYGYMIAVPDGELDAAEFDALTARARAVVAGGGELVEARELYRAALDLWRGRALAGICSPAVRAGAAALDERRIAALEDRVDVELRLAVDRGLVGELAELVQLHPLRERLRGQLMLALCRAGRQADALAVYRQGRQVLTDELGIEPGAALRDLHQRILAGDPALTGATAPGPAAVAADTTTYRRPASAKAEDDPATVLPARCLPRPIPDFTGRAASVQFLLAGARAVADGPVIQLIDGMAGSGKTTLAVHVARLLAQDYPDAHLFVDLCGHSERAPLEPAAALVTLLRQLGVHSERIPAEFDDRVALWRTELSRRRALVILDNAASSAQVAPLLPTSAGTTALVTSRRKLVDLDGVRPRSLGVLDEFEAVDLLARAAGPDRVAAEPDAAADVARRCGYLPLALRLAGARLAGARLAHRPRWRVADLAKRLSDDLALPELAAEDRNVAGAFDLSYTPLSPAPQRMFRLLGLYPGEWLDARAAAALADIPLDQAHQTLAELVDHHLVEEPVAGRYRLHDLIREYAASLASAHPDGVRLPLERLLDHYVHAASAAGDEFETPISRPRRPRQGTPRRPDLIPGQGGSGRQWLEQERGNISRLVPFADECGLHGFAWRLARACSRFYFVAGYGDDILATHQSGISAAHSAGDVAAAGWLHNYIAAAHFRTGNFAPARRHLSQAIESLEAVGDVGQAASIRINLATVYTYLGDLPKALRQCEHSLQVMRKEQHRAGIALAMQVMAEAHRYSGDLRTALVTCRLYLLLARDLGTLYYLTVAIGNLGAVRARLGDIGPALRLLTTALSLKRRVGNRYGEGETLNDLALVHRIRGDTHLAVTLHNDALAKMREVGARHGECMVLNDFGATLWAAGEPDQATQLHRQALRLAEPKGYLAEQAKAHDGLARCLTEDDPTAAEKHRERALELYRRLDITPRYELAGRCVEQPP